MLYPHLNMSELDSGKYGILAKFFKDSQRTEGIWCMRCKFCGKRIRSKPGITSNFHRHVRTNHLEMYKDAKEKDKKETKTKQSHSLLPFKAVAGGNISENSRSLTYNDSNPRQKVITEGIVKHLVAEAMLPLRIVESSGFASFMRIVDPNFVIPSRRTINRNLTGILQTLKDNLKSEIKLLVNNKLSARCVHASTDLWSSRSFEPIIRVKFHYFDEAFRLKTKTAAYRHFGSKHTGKNICAAFEEILSEYGMQSIDIGYVVTDNARNVLKASTIFSEEAGVSAFDCTEDKNEMREHDGASEPLNEIDEISEFLSDENVNDHEDILQDNHFLGAMHRLPCFVHTLQLAVKEALKTVPLAKKILNESSAVVVFFRRSLYWNEELQKKSDGLTLLAAVPTRWNSNLIMLRRLSQAEVWNAVNETLVKAKEVKGSSGACVPRISVSRSLVLELVSLLEPFEEATQVLQGDGVTISQVIPALIGIDEAIANCKTQLITLKKNLRAALHNRFQEYMRRPEYVVSTVLDCRFKLVPFGTTQLHNSHFTDSDSKKSPILLFPSANEAKSLLLLMMDSIKSEEVTGSHTAESKTSCQTEKKEPEPTTSSGRQSIFARYRCSQVSDTEDKEDSVYLNAPTEHSITAEQFWAVYGHCFPKLQQLARRLLSIPASSGSLEQLFSISGAFVSARKNLLSASSVESMLLLREHRTDLNWA